MSGQIFCGYSSFVLHLGSASLILQRVEESYGKLSEGRKRAKLMQIRPNRQSDINSFSLG